MNIKKIIDDYVECNNFEVKLKDRKIYIYYYEKIKHFTSDKITISYNNEEYEILGNKLVIETLFKEMIVISGKINSIVLKKYE